MGIEPTARVAPDPGRAWKPRRDWEASTLEPPLLWSSLQDGLEGLALIVRGELSTRTAPALDSLVEALLDARERLVSIDLRDTQIVPPAAERLLERWSAAPGHVPGTYRLDGG